MPIKVSHAGALIFFVRKMIVTAAIKLTTITGMCHSWGSFKARTVTAWPNGMIKSTATNAIAPFIMKFLSQKIINIQN
jgi:hypothetical protein